eukprot:scaffold148318_cov19-Tisochrysis_lutea.AAC.1
MNSITSSGQLIECFSLALKEARLKAYTNLNAHIVLSPAFFRLEGVLSKPLKFNSPTAQETNTVIPWQRCWFQNAQEICSIAYLLHVTTSLSTTGGRPARHRRRELFAWSGDPRALPHAFKLGDAFRIKFARRPTCAGSGLHY